MELKNEAKERSFDEDVFKDCDEKVRFYTGLGTWELLITPYLNERSSLTPFQQLVITLMRLQLVKDLSYHFRGHYSTISHTLLHVIDVLYYTPLILWPDRDVLYKTMAMDFRKN